MSHSHYFYHVTYDSVNPHYRSLGCAMQMMLLVLGFTFAQGFLFSPALSAERLEQWLQHETLPMPE